MSVIPAAIGVLSVVLVLFYPLNEAKVTEIEADLKARRAQAAPRKTPLERRNPQLSAAWRHADGGMMRRTRFRRPGPTASGHEAGGVADIFDAI